MNEKNKKELMFILPKLRRYCYGLTGNKDQGDDLLHGSVVKILAKFNLLKIENLIWITSEIQKNTIFFQTGVLMKEA